MGDKITCKCDRCGRIRPLFQYTVFKPRKEVKVQKVQDNGPHANPRYTPINSTEVIDLGEYRGLCEECAVVVNSAAYDAKSNPPRRRHQIP